MLKIYCLLLSVTLVSCGESLRKGEDKIEVGLENSEVDSASEKLASDLAMSDFSESDLKGMEREMELPEKEVELPEKEVDVVQEEFSVRSVSLQQAINYMKQKRQHIHSNAWNFNNRWGCRITSLSGSNVVVKRLTANKKSYSRNKNYVNGCVRALNNHKQMIAQYNKDLTGPQGHKFPKLNYRYLKYVYHKNLSVLKGR